MDFVVFPEAGNSDLLGIEFHKQHVAAGRSVLATRAFDTSMTGRELYDTLTAYGAGWQSKCSIAHEDWTILSWSFGDGEVPVVALFSFFQNSVWVNLSALDVDAAESFFDEFESGLPPIGEPDSEDEVEVRFWMLGPTGPTGSARTLEAYKWGDVQRNYPTVVREQLESLTAMKPPEAGGKLILWHGPPGNGKTSAIRTLIHAWKDWVNAEYVVDPEVFFGQSSYMVNVLNRKTHRSGGPDNPWRLIIIEDAGEFVNKDADTSTGQAFSRLLNITDGMIGQGLKVIVLITTNRPLSEMHEALRRPGRCLANIEFASFGPTEASSWLGGERVESDMSLAEMYERKERTVIETSKQAASTGQYL